ncbi:MAG: hypothetical protein ACRENY_07480 [Candidatus Dormibacteria bacterium]
MGAVALAGIVAAVAYLLLSGSSGIAQKQRDFASMVATLRSDLSRCNSLAAAAVSDSLKMEDGSSSTEHAEVAAHAAARACVPASSTAVWNLTVYLLPSSLQGHHLNYAVSALGVWAQEDVAPAMRAERHWLANRSDRKATTTYDQDAAWATADLASANLTLRRAAKTLGSNFRPLRLISLARAGPPAESS